MVAIVRNLPFLFILRIDWIIKNNSRLIVRDGEIQVESVKKGTDTERERIDGNHESGEGTESIVILEDEYEDKGEGDGEPLREGNNLEGTSPMRVKNEDERCNRIEFSVEPVMKVIRSISKRTGEKRVKFDSMPNLPRLRTNFSMIHGKRCK